MLARGKASILIGPTAYDTRAEEELILEKASILQYSRGKRRDNYILTTTL
jgi:hypothetical protein